jgi:uncharacterized protein
MRGGSIVNTNAVRLSVALICLMVFSFSYAQDQRVSDSGTLKIRAKQFVERLAQEDFSSTIKYFDSTMITALPVEKLREIWGSLISQAGHMKKQTGVRIEKSGQYEIVYVTCEFEKASLDIKVIFNSMKEIAGLFFAPSSTSSVYTLPAYTHPESFREKEVIVGHGEWALPGTITFPLGPGPFPALVLVHGSGPNDRDESIGPNKVFRDLAWGLASQGIAVLRYEKRTKVYAVKFNTLKDSFTVKEETIDDALAAASLLRRTKEIDTAHIFMLGHSLGGILIPRIGMGDPALRGFIIMAGATTPFEDIILRQMTYLFSLDDTLSEAEKTQLEQMKKQVAQVKDPTLSVTTPGKNLPFGAPAKYWLDLRGYQPSEMVKNLKQPLLIIQGGRDYQVTMEDFRGWKNSLSSRQNVEFKTYPTLNHLFIEGTGKSTPEEYQTAGHVAEFVIYDLAHWIKKY